MATAHKDPCSFGVAELENGNCIKRFVEKPVKGTEPSKLINAGVYVLSPKIFEYIPEGKLVSMEREVFPKLVEQRKLFGDFVDGMWMDIGKPAEYLHTNKVILDSLLNTLPTHKAQNYTIKMPVALDEGVTVGDASVLGPYAILGKNVKVGKNVQIYNSVVFADAKIGDNTTLNGAIVGEGAKIGHNVKLGKGCIIGDQAKIKDDIHLTDGLAICPAKEVSENILKPKIDC
jgi:mannose-1-phosphate guanylyltransferase